jgi:putative transposase
MMSIMDKHLTSHPTEGVTSMVLLLRSMGYPIGPKRIRRLFRIMGRETMYRRKNLTKCGLKAFIKPYLLKDMDITHSNQVWCTDITYIPMRKGFLYLVAIMDWFTRKVLAWRISNTLEANFCVEALNEAIHKFGPPEIMNTDQGSQFTSFDWTDRLKRAKTKISMDGKARYLDNIFIERLWRSLKYECVYLHAWETGSQAKAGVGRWITFYNHQRPHAAHGGQPPAVVYFNATQTDQQVQAVA